MSDKPTTLDPDSLGYQRIVRMQRLLTRRALLGGAAGAAAAALLAACGGTPETATTAPVARATATAEPTRASVLSQPTATAAPAAAPTAAPTAAATAAVTGAALPADAAPADQQVFVVNTGPDAKVIDFWEAVYARPAMGDLFSEPLVRLNKDFEVIPGAAETWSGSQDGKTWTFKLDRNLKWSDGNSVTADDYVATFRYGADPKHAWDFTWFFQGIIKGWDDAIAGKAPLDQLGVRRGEDPYTLIIETVVPAPYIPAMVLYTWPLSKAALEKTGPLYNTNPATAVSAGPFILKEWTKDQQIVYERNPKYTGKLKPSFTRIVQKIADPKTNFTAYQNDELDHISGLAPAEVQLVQGDPELAKQLYAGVGDFRCFYLFFDVTQAPFDNLKVRQAFSHVIDREAIQRSILGPQGTPAYSYLAPGFPGSNVQGLKEIQRFDTARAKQLLGEAGFPDGKGFPKQTMWLRNENPLNQAIANSLAASIKQHLGIEVEVSNKDRKLFMDNLTAKPTKIPFGYISYGMDFLDPFNMLSVWLSGGRHSWSNKDFDAKVKEAAAFLGSPEQRIKMFQDAERILVSDAPAVFIYFETQAQLFKPWVKGSALDPDKYGNKSLHWPGYTTASTNMDNLYMTRDVTKRKK